jgi:hypothetical protein
MRRRDLFLLLRKEEIDSQPSRVHLLVRVLPGVVVMLIVGVEFHVFAYGEQAARVDGSGAYFTVLTLIKYGIR